MKIAAISDTHGRQGWVIPDCDVFVHAGDITAGGSYAEMMQFIVAIEKRLKQGGIEHVLLVPGNHDQTCHAWMTGIRAATNDPRIHWLIDESFTYQGKTFWGSPWTPPFMDWFFMAEEDKLARIYESMPDVLDVLITHGPPWGILDPGFQAPHVGSNALLEAVGKRRIRHHVFGHLHGAGGMHLLQKTMFHNVAAVNEAYELTRGCYEFEI